jgi:hypothetical protein
MWPEGISIMLIMILIWVFLALCSFYAAALGGKTGRAGALLTVGATLATWFAQYYRPWSQTNFPVLVIDAALLVAFYLLALRSRVYWPIWAAGFHLITVAGHAATLVSPGFSSSIYYYFNGMWAIFVQLAMVWGITVDRIYLPREPALG